MKPSEEEWRPVVGWEGLYEVSNFGYVRVLDRMMRTGNPGVFSLRKGKVMTPDYKNNLNHGRISLTYLDRVERTWVHRIVARAFIGEPPPGKYMVLHWDDNPWNNHVDNLRYGDAMDNKDDAVRNGSAKRNPSHCPEGHEYIGDNLVNAASGSKRCRTCEYGVDRRRHFERLEEGIPREDSRHGTYAGYRAGCRCVECLESNRTYKREYAREWRKRKR